MAAPKKESMIKTQADLNAAASRAYHYVCGVCNAKTKEEYDSLGTELTHTIKDILTFKKNQIEGK